MPRIRCFVSESDVTDDLILYYMYFISKESSVHVLHKPRLEHGIISNIYVCHLHGSVQVLRPIISAMTGGLSHK